LRASVAFGVPKRLSEVMVIVDVFRSSTAITIALENGAKYIIPTNSIEEAWRVKSEIEGREEVLLVGERMGLTPEGFDMNISPKSMRKEIIGGKVLIYTSTNLTRILHRCRSAGSILIGGLINAEAVAKYLEKLSPVEVAIVACGLLEEVSLEDVVGAGAIIHNLEEIELSDTAALSLLAYENPRWRELVRRGPTAKYLEEIGFGEDVDFCLRENVSRTVPVLKGDKIISAKD